MASDKRYNGWTNYETWAVKLWMDNDQGTYEYWREHTRIVWRHVEDKYPNQFLDRSENARCELAEQLKADINDQNDIWDTKGIAGTVYADLLGAALSEVNWQEIANALLTDEELDGYKEDN